MISGMYLNSYANNIQPEMKRSRPSLSFNLHEFLRNLPCHIHTSSLHFSCCANFFTASQNSREILRTMSETVPGIYVWALFDKPPDTSDLNLKLKTQSIVSIPRTSKNSLSSFYYSPLSTHFISILNFKSHLSDYV